MTPTCFGCLKGLVERTVSLAGGSSSVRASAMDLLDALWEKGGTPPSMANILLRRIKEATGVYDPYESVKQRELEQAVDAAKRFESLFPPTLDGAIQFSALGNSSDFFVQDGFNPEGFRFFAPMDEIEEEIGTTDRDVLFLGDNVGDLLFDVKLIGFLKGMGKHVHYVVKEHPVQNDLSMKDVVAFNLGGLHDAILSTGTDEVGIEQTHLRGVMKRIWGGGGLVIAKGMGNYETISSFDDTRPVLHILKVKCAPVGEALKHGPGSYIAILGGDRNGNKKRLL